MTTIRLANIKKPVATEVAEEPTVMIDRFEVVLPARLFQITYKVAEKGGISMTGEFLLRLLHAVEQMKEKDIAAFFGFDRRELNFVMTEMTAHDYITHLDGYVCLTPSGRRLFTDNSGTPQIVSVEKHTDQFGFDLISLCPQDKPHFPKYALSFPRLTIQKGERAANATREVQGLFRRHFMEFATTKRQRQKQQYLYSVDHVIAEDKYFVTVPVRVMSKGGKSDDFHADLSEWRNMHELEDRADVLASVGILLEQFRQRPQENDRLAYKQLTNLAPDFLNAYTKIDGLSVESYHRTAIARAGVLRADRPTIPLLGSLLTPGNVEKLFIAIRHGLKRLDFIEATDVDAMWPKEMYWLPPLAQLGRNSTWGKTRALESTLEGVKKRLHRGTGNPNENQIRTVAVTTIRERSLKDEVLSMFNERRFVSEQIMPLKNFELMCVPGIAVAALVHAPIQSNHGFPVPLGFLSFDPAVVARVEGYFSNVTN
jgi:hypothetical protein